jgi:16S rRNA (cytidine1402-2'-O)-methyltransferase
MAKLYLVPTPIGNLEDMTIRAVKVLKEVDLILAEDTRKTGILLGHYGIQNKIKSHHAFNEHATLKSVIDLLRQGTIIALVTDAGTPSISDPGYLLLRECLQAGFDVECLPGPTALIPALVNSGLPSDRFRFEGFLPHKKGRQSRMKELAEERNTIILYESPHRLVRTLEQLALYFGEERLASVSRELTKIYEETKRGSLKDLKQYFGEKAVRGEIVIVIKGKEDGKAYLTSNEE